MNDLLVHINSVHVFHEFAGAAGVARNHAQPPKAEQHANGDEPKRQNNPHDHEAPITKTQTHMQTQTVELNTRAEKRTFRCVSYEDAVTFGYIKPQQTRALGRFLPGSQSDDGRYVRVTEWYSNGEGDMLERAYRQFHGCAVMLIRKMKAPRCPMIAIYRDRAEVKRIAGDE